MYLQHCFDVDVVINRELSTETKKGYVECMHGTTYADGFRDERYNYSDGTIVWEYRNEVVIDHPDGRQTRHTVRDGGQPAQE